MGLSASMWSGVSGLLVHGEKMNVVGHNIANVNTIGFKSQRMDFQDMFYNKTFTTAGLQQIGMGARVGVVVTDFSQGPFEQTGMSTDLAIQGKGFFQVRVPHQETLYYTRAGDFFFNKEGELTSPHGYILQGWQVPVNADKPIIATGSAPQTTKTSPILGAGVPRDIKLETWTVLPKETDRITTFVNISAHSSDHAIWHQNPFAALFNTWDGQLVDPVTGQPIDRQGRAYLAEDAYAYQSPIKIYDDAGVAHTVTIYFDKVDKDWNSTGQTYYDGGKPSQTIYEYLVTINPAEDNRMFWDPNEMNPDTGVLGVAKSIQTTQMAGILMSGTMTFGSNGDLVDLSSYTLMGGLEAVSKPNAANMVELQPNYFAVYTDPMTQAKTYYGQGQPGGTTIPYERISNTAFYPAMDMTDSVPTTPASAVVSAMWPGPSTVALATDPLVTTAWVSSSKSNAVAYSASPQEYTVNAGYRITVNGTTYPAGTVIDAAGPHPAFADLHAGINSSYEVEVPAYQVATHAAPPNEYEIRVNGRTYRQGEYITNPADVAALASPSGDSYCYELFPSSQVKTGYRVVGSDGNVYVAGNILPYVGGVPVTAASAEQILGKQNAMMSWYPTAVSNNGLPLMVANFTSVEQAHTVGSPLGKDHIIEMDFGIKVPQLANPWRNELPLGAPRSLGGTFADGVPDPYDKDTWASAGGLAGIAGSPIIGPDNCRLTGAASSSTMLSRQNGYTYGNLMDIVFDQRGVMSGIYSNGVTLPLYQVTLYDFVAPQHLRFEGGNLISETRDSGEPSWGAAGMNGFGTVNGYMIEQSNVDMAKEMVHMITTQRGFQSNSKVITTVDQMLEVVVNMKR